MLILSAWSEFFPSLLVSAGFLKEFADFFSLYIKSFIFIE